MRIRSSFPFDRLDSLSEGSFGRFISGRMVLFLGSCWISVINFLFYTFGYLFRNLFRYGIQNGSKKEDSSSICAKGDGYSSAVDNSSSSEPAPEAFDCDDSKNEGSCNQEGLGVCGRNGESKDIDGKETSSTANTLKYCFLSQKDFTGFVDAPEVTNFSIKESYVDWKGDQAGVNERAGAEVKDGCMSDEEFHRPLSKTEEVLGEARSYSGSEEYGGEFESEISEVVSIGKDCLSSNDRLIELNIDRPLDEVAFQSVQDIWGSNLNVESITFSRDSAVDGGIRDLESYDFLSVDHIDGFELGQGTVDYDSSNSDTESTGSNSGLLSVNNQADSYKSDIEDFSNGSSSLMNQMESSKLLDNWFLYEDDFHKQEASSRQSDEEGRELTEEPQRMKEMISPTDHNNEFPQQVENRTGTGNSKLLGQHENDTKELEGSSSATESADELHKSKTTNPESSLNLRDEELQTSKAADLQNSLDSDNDDSDGMEALWEHQDLIEQLRMELKKVRGTTLPTILEESESPRSVDDLKPWKMEDKKLQEDPMEELQKFYDSYREKMKRLDVLNYQKMHAMGFLQRKDHQLPSIAGQKTSSLRLLRRRKYGVSDQSSQFLRELECDLETIYVGQTCLSWELLHWQHFRSRDLPESNTRGRRRHYNQAVGEFQQFQVLLQRFVENEEFQGPRVRYYIQSRCVLRNLLQVPPIKEDSWNGKMEGSSRGEDAITSEMLAEVIEESMRAFWEFLRADRDEAPSILKGFLSLQAELQDPNDSHLLASIQADLQKKDKRVKDLLRSANCIVKRFQKHQGGCSDHSLFFSQVDLKLVARVLRMSRITSDQLLWCHKKLSKITFKNRKLYREPSFLLFPC